MNTQPITITGVVTNGVVVPHADATLAEGTRVEIIVSAPSVSPELQAEFDAWESASDGAFQHIVELEQQEP